MSGASDQTARSSAGTKLKGDPELRTTTFGGVASEPVGPWLAGKLGAGDLAALRSMDPVVLTEGAAAAGFFPFFTIDGRILPRQVIEAFDRGDQVKVPILAGAVVWTILLVLLLPGYPNPSALLLAASLVYPIFYVGLSLHLDRRLRAAAAIA